MHEIITLQLGQQANYLGTHFWNTQESYFTYSSDQPESAVDHDIHFRPGLAPDGTETYMPRTVIYDLKGAFGTLRKINALYDVNDDQSTPAQALWQGQPTIHRSPPIPESPYTASLNAGLPPPRLHPAAVRYFSDYSRVFYHPRSVVPLSEHDATSTGTGTAVGPFAERGHAAGEDLFAALDREHDLLDRDLRPFVEEADCMQAVQVFAGFDDAWGGFASRYVERVRDEYGKVGVWVWGLQAGVGGVSRDKRLLRLANKARAMTEVYKQASIVVPLAVPERLPGRVQLDLGSQWHTSALLAAAVESATLPARMKDPLKRETLGGMTEVLNTMGRQSVAGLQMSFARPDSEAQNDSREKKLSEEDLSEGIRLDIRLAPSDQLDAHSRSNGFNRPRVFSQLIASRGYGDEEAEDMEMDEAGRRVRRSSYEPVTKSYNTALRFPLLDSFPGIFRGDGDEPLSEALNIATSISTDSSVSTKLRQLRSTVIRSISLEDRETLGNELMEMADGYHEGWSSGSDFGEDD
ncbi:tubulin nucleotide-binding domain-like protein [Parathielavia hyrcaniae]|uniref:Tubulin nucleotide-binding domain-like protein n=1 Tax=Parathielavia hyrcaniae TaxID=113614 RepID=A0AAN6QFA8_9PEZI|nr:tubulin nucleotide-binding domain-like protein [Parathielavia hyrcaniae]